jgi:hypothetical protein
MGDRRGDMRFWWGNLRARDIGVPRMMILKLIL